MCLKDCEGLTHYHTLSPVIIPFSQKMKPEILSKASIISGKFQE